MQQTRSDWNPIRLLAVLLVAVLTIGILAACGGAAPAEEAPARVRWRPGARRRGCPCRQRLGRRFRRGDGRRRCQP